MRPISRVSSGSPWRTGSMLRSSGRSAPEAGVVDHSGGGDALRGADPGRGCIETDKAFCRRLMERHGIAGARYRVFQDPEEPGGSSGLRRRSRRQAIGLTGEGCADRANTSCGGSGRVRPEIGDVVLEERLIGEEFTLRRSSTKHLVPMPLVQDHKRTYEGDVGPNTGGMGSCSLSDHMLPFVTRKDYEEALGSWRIRSRPCETRTPCRDPLRPVREHPRRPEGHRVQRPIR